MEKFEIQDPAKIEAAMKNIEQNGFIVFCLPAVCRPSLLELGTLRWVMGRKDGYRDKDFGLEEETKK